MEGNKTKERIQVQVTRYGVTKGFRRGIYLISFVNTLVGMVCGLALLINILAIHSEGFTMKNCALIAMEIVSILIAARCGAKIILSYILSLMEKINDDVLINCCKHQEEINRLKNDAKVPQGTIEVKDEEVNAE